MYVTQAQVFSLYDMPALTYKLLCLVHYLQYTASIIVLSYKKSLVVENSSDRTTLTQTALSNCN